MLTSQRHPQAPPGLRPLLSSFPSPPSHIPSSPSSFRLNSPISPIDTPNPPPCFPPTDPLPPVPEGPPKFTQEHIALLTMHRASYASTSSRLSTSSKSRLHSRKSSNSTSGDEGPQSTGAFRLSSSVSPILLTSARTSSSTASTDSSRLSGSTDSHSSSLHNSVPSQTQTIVLQTPNRKFIPRPISSTSDGDSTLTEQHPPVAPENGEAQRDRASSPDIAEILQRTQTNRSRSSTPGGRPGRRSRSSHSSGRRSLPGIKRLRSTPALSASSTPCPTPDATPFPTQSNLGAEDDDVDPDPDLWELTGVAAEPDAWEQVWEAPGVEDSEEDVIDLLTPLPNLMLRAGLLSPHSKLLPKSSPTPDPTPPSTSSKAALPRDDRDTVKRRQRHKDGKLLRGGIGLTTGLGWSDSEDEDAPSALTNRLSRLAPTLSRKHSMASSLGSSASSVRVRSSNLLSTAPSAYTRSTPVSRSVSNASSIVTTRSITLSRPASARSMLSTASTSNSRQGSNEQLAALSHIDHQSPIENNLSHSEIDVPSYPYLFSPPSPTDSGHSHLSIPWVRKTSRPSHTQEDRSPTPTNWTPSSGSSASTGSFSAPITPRDGGLPYPLPHPRTRPPSKALPPLPTRMSVIPKTASMSSIQSVAKSQGQGRITPSASSTGLRDRATSNASTGSIRARPEGSQTSTGRPRTLSTSSTGSNAGATRPLKSAIKSTITRSTLVAGTQ